MVAFFGESDAELLRLSHGAIRKCAHSRESLSVVDVKEIVTVVAMVPYSGEIGSYFLVEKMGLGGIQLAEDDKSFDEE